jgi:hypothetical protein
MGHRGILRGKSLGKTYRRRKTHLQIGKILK